MGEGEDESLYKGEAARIKYRREQLNLQPFNTDAGRAWGLALSGGGIRSATFCLGVLQALARTGRSDKERILLERFDYLSTVSGGGYIGAFFSSLFLPDRLRGEGQSPAAAAAQAYAVLAYEPPGKISSSIDYSKAPAGSGPAAWLRENGRYLTPTGGGDMFYALATTWRNWLSLHFVIGMPVLMVLALLFAVQAIFYLNLFWCPFALAVGWMLPSALAYWLVIPGRSLDEKPNLANPACKGTLAVTYCLVGIGLVLQWLGDWRRVDNLVLCLAVITGVAGLFAALCVRTLPSVKAGNTVRNYRVVMTRHLSLAMRALLVCFFLACIAKLGQELYTSLFNRTHAVSVGVLPALVWLIRKLALLRDEKALPTWLPKLPLELLALAAGVVLSVVVCLGWSLAALWLVTNGSDRPLAHHDSAALVLLAVIALALTWLSGQFKGFLNLSSLHAFYATRLTRAYLGASNGKRFTTAADEYRSVAEPMVDDDISLDRFYGTCTAGPLHLINVTMNLTVDPAEQLVQRDRKGQPLCLAPDQWKVDATSTSFFLDGVRYRRDTACGQLSEILLPHTLAQWIGTSGAAFTTGLGRTTSLGLSLTLGLANIRLGVWWPSRFLNASQTGYVPVDGPWVQRFATQSYLFREFTAQFHGHRNDLMYLSDGGHFENTGAYELLRSDRNIELIVMCDCGCDPEYRFNDLANLVRLARIDMKLDIREDTAVSKHFELGRVFGTPDHFQHSRKEPGEKCALLYDVFDMPQDGRSATLKCRILVLKPRLMTTLGVDVLNYAQSNEAFPQQPTSDQFFDEAQFESYRQLGLAIGRAVFGDMGITDVQEKMSQALWRYLALP
ncbi:patatin-like phospholipase family protein [Pseudomonas sp. HR96]|uniref:patatin-like phospholipase family protein n=1 Tax=Pseudomonas sp. HR96 TaxID=1027966 RepID=UPI002A752FD1|nr:patatin-like phospholipase family protein [Pseudomonas sp. HR96]WPP00811.1 patatin-like phospholipase family protein [Pseudomonas sp. HR96]